MPTTVKYIRLMHCKVAISVDAIIPGDKGVWHGAFGERALLGRAAADGMFR